MRRLILVLATAVLAVGTRQRCCCSISQPHEQAAIHSTDPNVQRVDYYWNHHRMRIANGIGITIGGITTTDLSY